MTPSADAWHGDDATAPQAVTVVVSHGEVIAGSLQSRPVLWWSFTKTVLAAAALALVRDGKLALDTTVEGNACTLRQLLCHTGGVPNYSDLKEYADAVARNDPPWPVDEMLERVRRVAPVKGWRYSNTGYLLVRRMIEAAIGADLQESLRQVILSPLGIEGVSVAALPNDLDDTEWGNPGRYHPAWVYHGLLIGSPASASLLLDKLLTSDFLPPSLLAEMTGAYPLGEQLPGRPGLNFGYGMGLMIARDGPAGASLGHTGAGPMSVAAVYRFPEPGCTVASFAPVADQAVAEWAAHHVAAARNQR